jgi:hypothetical protein
VLSQHFRNSRAPFKPHSVAASGSLGCELWQIFARALASEAHFSAAPVCFCAAIDGVFCTNKIEHATATQRSLLIVHLASSICTPTACCRNLNPGATPLVQTLRAAAWAEWCKARLGPGGYAASKLPHDRRRQLCVPQPPRSPGKAPATRKRPLRMASLAGEPAEATKEE